VSQEQSRSQNFYVRRCLAVTLTFHPWPWECHRRYAVVKV